MLKKMMMGVLVLACSATTWAQWKADDVDVSFLTTKVTKNATTITELNTFDKATAIVNFDGKLKAVVDLGSIDTGIDIRDGRLKDNVFNTAHGLELLVNGKIDMNDINTLDVGQSIIVKQPLHLTFGAHKADVTAELLVVRNSEDVISITTLQPILLDLTLFGVNEGISKLTELAGLETIALQVPTLLHTTFTRVGK